MNPVIANMLVNLLVTPDIWPGWLPEARDVVAIFGVVAFTYALLVTLFRSFTRERVFALLESDNEKHTKFVLGIIKADGNKAILAATIVTLIRDPQWGSLFKAAQGDLWSKEIEARDKTARDVGELGRLVGQQIQASSDAREFMGKMSTQWRAADKTNALLAQALDGLRTGMESIHEEVKSLRNYADDTREYVRQQERIRSELDVRAMESRGIEEDRRGLGPGRRRPDMVHSEAGKILGESGV